MICEYLGNYTQVIIRDSKIFQPKILKVGRFKSWKPVLWEYLVILYLTLKLKLIEENGPNKMKTAQGHAHFQVKDSILPRNNPV